MNSSNYSGTEGCHFNLDAITFREGVIFGFGWAFHEFSEVETISVLSRYCCERPISAVLWKPRPDVRAAFPTNQFSLHSGFFFYGSLSPEPKGGDLALRLGFKNGQTFDYCVPCIAQDGLGPADITPIFRRYITKSLNYLKGGQFKTLLRSIRRHLRSWPKNQVPEASIHLMGLLAPMLTEKPVLIIDHSLGGGANRYRNNYVKDKLTAGHSVMILSFHVPTLQLTLDVHHRNRKKSIALTSLDLLEELASAGKITEIFFNNCVSFNEPTRIPELLYRLKTIFGIPFTVSVHDYISVCPSQFLLDCQGKYCDVPDLTVCDNCLPNHSDGFVSLFRKRDIRAWRHIWGQCLDVADDILCFSESSRNLLIKAHPTLPPEKFSFIPHRIPPPPRRARLTFNNGLHIGIVGQIGYNKGAAVVRDLAEEIAARRQHIPITVIGALELGGLPPFVRETGEYQPEKLCTLIEETGANTFLFPSICPETFSYVTEELLQLEVPLLCFDIGAPAERVGNYKFGKVVHYSDSKSLLDDLLRLHSSVSNSMQA